MVPQRLQVSRSSKSICQNGQIEKRTRNLSDSGCRRNCFLTNLPDDAFYEIKNSKFICRSQRTTKKRKQKQKWPKKKREFLSLPLPIRSLLLLLFTLCWCFDSCLSVYCVLHTHSPTWVQIANGDVKAENNKREKNDDENKWNETQTANSGVDEMMYNLNERVNFVHSFISCASVPRVCLSVCRSAEFTIWTYLLWRAFNVHTQRRAHTKKNEKRKQWKTWMLNFVEIFNLLNERFVFAQRVNEVNRRCLKNNKSFCVCRQINGLRCQLLRFVCGCAADCDARQTTGSYSPWILRMHPCSGCTFIAMFTSLLTL